MTKFIWMSDPHFQNTGTIDGLDPRARLNAALDHANTHYGAAEFILLTGDLVGDDIEADYTALSASLARSALPIYPLMGNNDARDGFRAHLSLPKDAMPDFIQYPIEMDEGVLLCLDTHLIGSHAGQFCAARLAWLETALEASRGPVYIAMHHPPFALGLPAQDQIALEDGGAFMDLITRFASVKHLFMGHVHRPTSGTRRGIPFATIGALSFQAPAPRPDWDWDSFKHVQEPPHYAVVELDQGDATLQIIQFCAPDFGMGPA